MTTKQIITRTTGKRKLFGQTFKRFETKVNYKSRFCDQEWYTPRKLKIPKQLKRTQEVEFEIEEINQELYNEEEMRIALFESIESEDGGFFKLINGKLKTKIIAHVDWVGVAKSLLEV